MARISVTRYLWILVVAIALLAVSAQVASAQTSPQHASETEDTAQPAPTREPAPDVADELTDEPASSEQAMTPTEYQQVMRSLLARGKAIAAAKISAKLARKKQRQLMYIFYTIAGLSGLGVMLLFLPLVWRKRHPGQGARLFKYSALSVGLVIVSINLFALSILGLRAAQSVAAEHTNPQIAMVNGALDTIDEHLLQNEEALMSIGPMLEDALVSLNEGNEDVVARLMSNFSTISEDLSVLSTMAKWFKGLDWLLGALPMILSTLVVLVFFLAFRKPLTDLAKLPLDAVDGRITPQQATKRALSTVGKELVVTAIVVAALIAVTMLSTFFLGDLVRPAMSVVLTSIFGSLFHLMQTESVSTAAVLTSMLSMFVFLLLTVGVVIASGAIFLGKLQKVLRARLHDGVPLARNKAFFVWGTMTLVGAHVVPWLFMKVGYKGIEKIFVAIDNMMTALIVSGVLLVVGFIIFLWAARVFKGLKWMIKFKPADADLGLVVPDDSAKLVHAPQLPPQPSLAFAPTEAPATSVAAPGVISSQGDNLSDSRRSITARQRPTARGTEPVIQDAPPATLASVPQMPRSPASRSSTMLGQGASHLPAAVAAEERRRRASSMIPAVPPQVRPGRAITNPLRKRPADDNQDS